MKIIRYILALLLLPIACTAIAQTPHSAYFLENMPTRHRMNPAFAPEFNYFNIPALGGTQIGTNANIGLGTFLYPRGNEMVTALHSSVGTKEFLDKLHSQNTIEADIKVNVVSFGFKKWGGYNTFDLTAHSLSGVYLPYDLFAFAKQGQIDGAPTSYNIKDLGVRSTNYAELSFGHSRKITDKLTVGAKVKFLAGIVNANANIDNIDVYMSGDKWSIRESGQLFTTDLIDVQYNDKGEIENFDIGSFGIDGNGFGIDLGATYQLLDNLTLSAALTDIGFLKWKGTNATVDSKEFIFDGFTHIGAEDDEHGNNAFDDETDQLEEDLKELIRFQQEKSASSLQTLTTTLNVGAEYSILSEKISFGLLSSTRFGMPRVWTELMASANFRPVSWFNAAINGSVSNMHQSMGFLLNFCPEGFNFFIGSDYIPFKYGKQGIPVNSAKFNFLMGINFTFNHCRK